MHEPIESSPRPRRSDDAWGNPTTSAEVSDAETVNFWRGASPEAHAQAMIELARYAELMVVTTGFGKDPDEQFPGLRASGFAGDDRSR